MTDRALPRLAPLPRDQWDDDVRAVFRAMAPAALVDQYFSTGSDALPVPNVLATLAHHPALSRPFLEFNKVLLRRPALSPRLRELAILRVAWRTRSAYEWGQHVRLAAHSGLDGEDVAAVGEGPSASRWSSEEADVLAATDQMIDHYRVDDGTWSRLAAALDTRQLVELVFVVGTYTCLAMAFNSFGLQDDPEMRAEQIPPLPPANDQEGAG